MIILGIETSCDDTGIAVIEADKRTRLPARQGSKRGNAQNFKILSNVISSQIKVHAPFGGVVPNLAAREHLKNIGPCLKTALKEANKTIKEIDLIAVTVGPGLIPSLLIGVNFTKALAYKYNIPIVPINHLEGHITVAFGNGNFSRVAGSRLAGPTVALLVSGGHTQLILMKKPGQYKIIGETRDDAAGECFDKTAKLLGLGYPGGPVISAKAEKFKVKSSKFEVKLPRPMMNQNNFDFSFSGLKTAVLYLVRDVGRAMSHMIPEICYETQQAIIDVLISKTFKAVEKYKAKTIILSGGVAANEELRKQFAFKIKNSKLKIQFLVPTKNLCMDNGTMIAMAGYNNRNKASKKYSSITANANLRLK